MIALNLPPASRMIRLAVDRPDVMLREFRLELFCDELLRVVEIDFSRDSSSPFSHGMTQRIDCLISSLVKIGS